MQLYSNLNHFWHRGQAFLDCTYPIIGGAMTWVSESNLVAAISNAGGFGVIASGAMPAEILRNEIKATRKKTTKNFGVNLITLNPEIESLMQICIEEKITYVVLAGGLPSKQHIEHLKQNNIKVICFAPALTLAKKMIRQGADALIVEGCEAGGHIGPVSTSVLAQEILPHIKEVPIFIAGGIAEGSAIASYLMMGAAGVQLGTKFVCATESITHDNFKQAFIKANARDATASVQIDPRFPVIPVRALKNNATASFMEKQRELIQACDNGEMAIKDAQLNIEHFWAGRLKSAAIDGDIENGSIMAGQSVGMIKSIQPAHEIIQELCQEADSQLVSCFG